MTGLQLGIDRHLPVITKKADWYKAYSPYTTIKTLRENLKIATAGATTDGDFILILG